MPGLDIKKSYRGNYLRNFAVAISTKLAPLYLQGKDRHLRYSVRLFFDDAKAEKHPAIS